ncbi:MAG TPA: hypothetical protein P5186_25265 [Candidatus Paceibacterota bacterium]|nr:hypothetical protein [Candidatus Paceibacterota bacterium]
MQSIPYSSLDPLTGLAQCEGHDVRCRNIWIKELDLKEPDTDFTL